MAPLAPLPRPVLPDGIRARIVHDVNGLDMHVLEAGRADRPCVLLLHGFPELAYSWRRVMLPLAAAGFHSPRRRA
jgi:pimeloyl-ACP methyl ester carboxylesterase